MKQQSARALCGVLSWLLVAVASGVAAQAPGVEPELVLAGGRVVDPDTGLDAIRDVYVRERRALTLMQALGKMTIAPARRLEGAAPQMAKKGRVQVGADADVTVFDPGTILDRATLERGDLPAAGVVHVAFVEGVRPGRAIRGGRPS